MNRIIITVLVTVAVILGGVSAVLWFKYKEVTATPPDKMEILSNELKGTGKLILAEEKVYQEYIKKFEKGPAKAKVLFRWMTTFQYLIDLQSPEFIIEKDGNMLKVSSPVISLNTPLIDISTYKPGIVIDGSIWINEHKLINDEMQDFKNRSQAAGNELIKNTRVLKLCTDQLKLAVLKIASGLQIQVDDVEIQFGRE
ncbi:MAG TPA: hypothetical protein PKZ64_14140 [Spirochaetota bacterium]|nr:hypothetical protein [Spirochaetota bacterium]HPR73866.1 hypothetical protein [Bacteroidales bacterium]